MSGPDHPVLNFPYTDTDHWFPDLSWTQPTLQPLLCVPTPTSNFGPIVGKRGSSLYLLRELTEAKLVAEDLGKKVDPREG